jgi:hypothetical protein
MDVAHRVEGGSKELDRRVRVATTMRGVTEWTRAAADGSRQATVLRVAPGVTSIRRCRLRSPTRSTSV